MRLAPFERRLRPLVPLLALAVAPAFGCAKTTNGGEENTLALCQDGVDNDGDDFIDCADQDCAALSICGQTDSGMYPDVTIPPGCGNGFLEGGEECDEGKQNGMGDCRINCTLRACGDSIVDFDEECDEGTMNSDIFPDACREDCTEARCGDLVIDTGEACDNGPDNSDVLPDRCRSNCQAPGCGDGVLDSSEACDEGTGNSDTDPNACRSGCTFPTCGDGIIDNLYGEGCDGAASCNMSCAPVTCGNGAVEGTESCDGMIGAMDNCATFGFAGGLLACSASCGYDTTQCTSCGNGTVEGGEQCDGTNLEGHTCNTVTGAPGTLACDPFCYFDTSGCMTCGNGMLDVGEDCDGTNLGGNDCISLMTGYTGGTLACDGTCNFDTASCSSAPCDPTGTWNIAPPISYQCDYVLTSYNTLYTITAWDITNGANLVASGTPIGFGAMSGPSTTCPSGSFTATLNVGGACAAVYTLNGTFTGPTSWTGSLEATYSGSCGSQEPCTNQLWNFTATR